MLQSGHPGARLSLKVWLDLMRHLNETGVSAGISVGRLAKLSPLPAPSIKLMLGCLERWRFIRMRDLVAQTEEFMRDPAAALPHYPLWDMNRGFGP